MRIRTIAVLVVLLSAGGMLIALAITKDQHSEFEPIEVIAVVEPAKIDGQPEIPEKACVFNSVFGEETVDSFFVFHTPEKALSSLDLGLAWLADAQLPSGGFGAGFHAAQHIQDPHAVPADPATTSMVAMAILRSAGLNNPQWEEPLTRAVDFLVKEVNESDPGNLNITSVTGTQIQGKLGQNIDVVMTAQLFNNLLLEPQLKQEMKANVTDALAVCVNRIEKTFGNDGTVQSAGWAGVLQSSFANSALEVAQANGIDVNEDVLEQSRKYQNENVDTETGDVKTDMGAGIVLYSVSGSSRSSAKGARKARQAVEKAKKEGKVSEKAEINADVLRDAGYDDEEATRLATSYKVYESAKVTAQDKRVMTGYGNNGGEEFLSFLQTGESLVINKDQSWKRWYEDVSGKLIAIQNQDGSWNGHHCITSPVFCTATCLLILSVQNDLESLVAVGD